jgi:DNA-binding NarL/FixJ family response regulator
MNSVADGLGNREIAERLSLSEHTVKNYMFHIFDKLGISNRVELVLYAVSNPRRDSIPSSSQKDDAIPNAL